MASFFPGGQDSWVPKVDLVDTILASHVNDIQNAVASLEIGGVSVQNIAYAASITPNVPAGEYVIVGTLTGNITVNAPTNALTGRRLAFRFTQDGTGGRTVTWNAIFKLTNWTISLAPSAKTEAVFTYDGSNWILAVNPPVLAGKKVGAGFEVYNLQHPDYGAKGDGLADAKLVMSNASAVLTSTNNPFLATDVGKGIVVAGAGAAAAVLATTIASFQSAGQVTLAANAQTAVNNVSGIWFTDNTTAIQTVLNAATLLGSNTSAKVIAVEVPAGIFGCLGQLTVPKNTVVKIRGAGRGASMLYYGGATQQRFLQFAGGNAGSKLESICICGPWADPAVDIQSNIGGGDTYNVDIMYEDLFIGFSLAGNATQPNAMLMSYSGANIQCDVFSAVNVSFYGRNYGCRLRIGTTDAYFSNGCVFSGNAQGGESRGIGLWCEDSDGTTLFGGTVHISNCNAALGAEAAVLLRSVANVYGLYIETAKLPVKLVSCQAKIYGGKIATNDVTALHLITATGSTGKIDVPLLAAPVAANALLDLVNITGSPRNNSWDLMFPAKGAIIGTLPATLLSVDTPNTVSWPGVASRWRTAAVQNYGVNFTPDWSLAEENIITLTGAINVVNPNPGYPPWPGVHLRFIWIQDATGGRVVTYNAVYKTTNAPAFSTALSTVTIDDFIFDGSASWRLASRTTGIAV